VGDDSHLVFRQKLLGKYGSVRGGVVKVKEPGPFSPNFGATSSYVFTQSPQNVAVEPGINSLACWDRCFALPQLLYRWRHQSGIFWIPPRRSHVTKLSTIQVYRFYELCQGFTNHHVSNKNSNIFRRTFHKSISGYG
jgi:hypothetical protein